MMSHQHYDLPPPSSFLSPLLLLPPLLCILCFLRLLFHHFLHLHSSPCSPLCSPQKRGDAEGPEKRERRRKGRDERGDLPFPWPFHRLSLDLSLHFHCLSVIFPLALTTAFPQRFAEGLDQLAMTLADASLPAQVLYTARSARPASFCRRRRPPMQMDSIHLHPPTE